MDKCDYFVKENKKDKCNKENKCKKIFEDVLDNILITEIKEEKKECKKFYE